MKPTNWGDQMRRKLISKDMCEEYKNEPQRYVDWIQSEKQASKTNRFMFNHMLNHKNMKIWALHNYPEKFI